MWTSEVFQVCSAWRDFNACCVPLLIMSKRLASDLEIIVVESLPSQSGGYPNISVCLSFCLPLTFTWAHLRCDVGLEEGEYRK